MHAAARAPHGASFSNLRRLIFGIALAGYVLSFFHRTAPAAIASELTAAFAIDAAVLGTLAATYFYVYTLLQIPVGVLADTLGPRRILTWGSLIAAAGSLMFALAPAWTVAAVGRTLVGIGVSVTFIAVLKILAVWFPANRFATLAGVTLFAGNLGAVLAGAPLAWLVGHVSWRSVFGGLAVLSAFLGIASWLRVRDRPPSNDAGAIPRVSGVHWKAALAGVLRNPATWPGFFVNVGIGGSYLAFAGLWAVPWLENAHGMSRVAAAQHASALLLGVAFGAFAVGAISDRLGSRAGVMRAYAVLFALAWIPLLMNVDVARWASLAWFLMMGSLIPGFTLTWTIAKEVNHPGHSGIATAVVNVGIFLGTGILQPLVGWLIDRGRATGDVATAWQQGVLLMAGAAAFGAVMTLFVRERKVG